uniref:Uncharacterized protein n=1 Tax=Oryza brachyantha TaxID=4533 RepID=J3L8X0_ORYBR
MRPPRRDLGPIGHPARPDRGRRRRTRGWGSGRGAGGGVSNPNHHLLPPRLGADFPPIFPSGFAFFFRKRREEKRREVGVGRNGKFQRRIGFYAKMTGLGYFSLRPLEFKIFAWTGSQERNVVLSLFG